MKAAMKVVSPLAFAAAVLAMVVGLSACGEKPQTATARKLDVAPSQGSTVSSYTAAGWKPGDATSWETQIKKRAEGQNEYTRTQRN
jgi:ABC-type glycerol-3-phosphate transport system substrate-binding protein